MANIRSKRKELIHELVVIEKQIYDLETNYLEETRQFGNIFVGWQDYFTLDKNNANNKARQELSKKSKKGGGTNAVILNEERLFSLSSTSSVAFRRSEEQAAKAIRNATDIPFAANAEDDMAATTVDTPMKKKQRVASLQLTPPVELIVDDVSDVKSPTPI